MSFILIIPIIFHNSKVGIALAISPLYQLYQWSKRGGGGGGVGDHCVEKYENFVFIFRSTGKCATRLWTCLHHMVKLRSQNKIKDFFIIVA